MKLVKKEVYVLESGLSNNDVDVALNRAKYNKFMGDCTVRAINAPVINGMPTVIRFQQDVSIAGDDNCFDIPVHDEFGTFEMTRLPICIIAESSDVLNDLVLASLGRKPRESEIKFIIVK